MEFLPLVSCIMPTYGRPKYVDESVEMFLRQDYPNKELIVVNDCAGQRFAGDYPSVFIVNLSSRFNSLGDKRNHCIDIANGSVIAICDDDDIYLPWWLSYSISEMDRLKAQFYRPAKSWSYWGDKNLTHNPAIPGWGNHGSVTFSKDLWKELGGYSSMNCGEDSEFLERVQKLLGQPFIKYDIASVDRFFVLRGTSYYKHMSMKGGQHPLDTRPGNYAIRPTAIRDPILRAAYDRLVVDRAAKRGARDGSECNV